MQVPSLSKLEKMIAVTDFVREHPGLRNHRTFEPNIVEESKLIYTSCHEQSDAAESKVDQRHELSRELREQRADAREHLGLFSRVRDAAAAE